MGLDITAYEKAVLLDEHPRTDDCYDDHCRAYVIDPWFTQSLRGLVADRCYDVGGETFGFRAGSYSGYNRFRRTLSQLALGVGEGGVYNEPGKWRDKPFFELINFADNEGTIGPEASADLAADFIEHGELIVPQLDEYDRQTYENFTRAFRIAADSGLVDFH